MTDLSRIPSFYHAYVKLVPTTDVIQNLITAQQELLKVLQPLSETKWLFQYQQDKWSIKTMVQHIIDAERIFAYRALRMARRDTTDLPGFDENLFAGNSHADSRNSKNLMSESATVHESGIKLFESFNNEDLDAVGRANGSEVYVEGIGHIMAGHKLHHLNVLRERYLQ